MATAARTRKSSKVEAAITSGPESGASQIGGNLDVRTSSHFIWVIIMLGIGLK